MANKLKFYRTNNMKPQASQSRECTIRTPASGVEGWLSERADPDATKSAVEQSAPLHSCLVSGGEIHFLLLFSPLFSSVGSVPSVRPPQLRPARALESSLPSLVSINKLCYSSLIMDMDIGLLVKRTLIIVQNLFTVSLTTKCF